MGFQAGHHYVIQWDLKQVQMITMQILWNANLVIHRYAANVVTELGYVSSYGQMDNFVSTIHSCCGEIVDMMVTCELGHVSCILTQCY